MKNEKVFSHEFMQAFAEAAKDGKIEIVQRTGEAAVLLKPEEPILREALIKTEGRIDSVFQFLSKRHHLFNPEKSHLHVDYDNKSILFLGNEQSDDEDYVTEIEGQIKLTKDYLNIPFGDEFDAKELGRQLRKRKHLFPDKDLFKKVFQELSSFKAKVNKEVENSDDTKGNKHFQIKENVIHSLTTNFTLKFEVLKGGVPIEFDVEIDIDASTLKCSLYAPEVESIIEGKAKIMIGSELNKTITDNTSAAEAKTKEIAMKDWCFVYFV